MGMKHIKCVVVGDAGVGKTCLSRRFTFGTGPNNFESKMKCDHYVHTMVDPTPVEIDVCNIAGESSCIKAFAVAPYFYELVKCLN